MRMCVDCSEPTDGKSPRCPEHRLEQRRIVNRRHFASWLARNSEHRREQQRAYRRPAQVEALRARAARLGYRLVKDQEALG